MAVGTSDDSNLAGDAAAAAKDIMVSASMMRGRTLVSTSS